MSKDQRKMRWDPYQLRAAHEFDIFWADRLKDGKREMLFLVGRGFDARANVVPSRIIGLGKAKVLHGWMLRYRNGQLESGPMQKRIEANLNAFTKSFGAGLTDIEINMRGAGNSNVNRETLALPFQNMTSLRGTQT